MEKLKYHDILYSDDPIGPYPTHLLRRVDKPAKPEDFKDWDGSIEWLHRRADEQRERLIQNNFVDLSEYTQKWWLPLDEVDGKLVVSTGRNRHRLCREYPLQNR